MTWVRLDDAFPRNNKILRIGKDAKLLYIMGLCHCASNLTDGLIETKAARLIAAYAEVDDFDAAAQDLAREGLWQPVEHGYLVHDYLKYNPTAEAVIQQREQNALRQNQWRAKHNGGSNAVTDTVTNDHVTPAPVPVPVPVPNPVPEPNTDCAESAKTPNASRSDTPSAEVLGSFREVSEVLEAPKPKRRRRPPIEHAPGFSEFWQACPRQERRRLAQAEYDKAVLRGQDPGALLLAVQHWRDYEQAKGTETKYTQLPQNWLKEGRWEEFAQPRSIQRQAGRRAACLADESVNCQTDPEEQAAWSKRNKEQMAARVEEIKRETELNPDYGTAERLEAFRKRMREMPPGVLAR